MTPQNETRSTRALRAAAVTTNFSFLTAGGILSGFLPMFTGMTLAAFGVLVATVAQVLLGLADLFFVGSTDPDRAALWNAWSVFALAFLAAIFWFGWAQLGPASLAILAVLAVLHVVVRVVRPAPAGGSGV